jgi:hypothetical protein
LGIPISEKAGPGQQPWAKLYFFIFSLKQASAFTKKIKLTPHSRVSFF